MSDDRGCGRPDHARAERRLERERRRAERRAERSEARRARRAARRGQRGEREPFADDDVEAGRPSWAGHGFHGAAPAGSESNAGRAGRAARESRPPHAGPTPAASDAEPLADAELLEEVRSIADAKARLVRDVLHYTVVVGVLAFVFPMAAWIVGVVWGLDLSSKLARRVVEPALRQRWIDREVSRRLRRAVPVERRQIEGEHSRRIGELAAGVAHEIRNPITAAKSLVQQMGEDPAARENVDYARVALDELERVEKSVAHLLRFAREEELRAEPFVLSDVIDSALQALHERIARAGVEVDCEVDAVEPLRGDAEQLRRVLLNLLINALDALEEGAAPPQITVQAGENLAGTEVWVRVRDNGPGIEAERLARIFSPFYTSKDGGTGLGLAISKKVVDAHGGSIEARSEPGHGAEFVVTLPRTGGAGPGTRAGSPT